MVYKLFNDGINESFERKPGAHIKQSQRQLPMETDSTLARLLIVAIRLVLIIYDLFSLPIYFLLQRPDKRAYEAQRTKSERVDVNTWIKTTNEGDGAPNHKKRNYLGSTMNEIFSNAVGVHSSKACLGYRAVITCPALVSTDEQTGDQIIEDKSFRSDYTWYTYEQIGRRVQDIASGLYCYSIYPDSRAFFFSSTSLEWFIAAQACFQLACQIVLAPEINDANSLKLILDEAEVDIVFVTCDKLIQLCKLFESIKFTSTKEAISNSSSSKIGVQVTDVDAISGTKHESSSCMVVDEKQQQKQLKTVVIIDWQFSIDFNEPLFAQLRDASNGIVDIILSMGQVEEVGVENPIELSCTKYLNQQDQLNLVDEQRERNKITQITKTTRKANSAAVSTRPLTPMVKNRYNTQLKAQLNSSSNRLGEMKEQLDDHVDDDDDDDDEQKNDSTDELIRYGNDLQKRRLVQRRSTTSLLLGSNLLNTIGSSKNRLDILHSIRNSDYSITNHYEVTTIRNKNEVMNSPKSGKLRNLSGEEVNQPQPNDLAMIVYSHASLGQMKAVTLTHNYLARCSHYQFLDGLVDESDIHCTTLGLDNVIEYMTEMCVFCHGGSIGYSCNSNTLFYDGKDLFQRDASDLKALNPTFLLVRPYILERLRSSVENFITREMNAFKGFILANVLYEYKKYWARRHFETPLVDRVFCSQLRRLFGKRIKYILCNGATDCTQTKDFFAFVLNIPVIELYSCEEAVVSLISVNDIWDYKRRIKKKSRAYTQFVDDDEEEELEDFQDMQLMPPRINKNNFKEDSFKNLLITSSILCPTLETRVRLEDWEDFRTSDQPYPRGRLVIGGELVCKGYFKKAAATKASFYQDSNRITWFRTNDLARVFPNGSFEIISAMTDMIKMVDGQFISLSQIEHILRNSQFVENVCAICGDDRKFVIALVVPNLLSLAMKSPAKANLKMAIGSEPDPEELIDVEFRREVCNDRLLCEFVDEHLSELIAKAGFQSIPSKFFIVPEIWTPETELVTPSFEPKRNAIQKYYAYDIQSIFKMSSNFSRNRLSARSSRPRKFSNPL